VENLEEIHTYICISDDYNGLMGYKNGFLKMIAKEIDQTKYRRIIVDDGIIENTHYLFCSFRFEPLD
jgi:hypothetical protein